MRLPRELCFDLSKRRHRGGTRLGTKINVTRKYPPVLTKSQRPTSAARLNAVWRARVYFNYEITTHVDFGLLACWANCEAHGPQLVIEDELITVEKGPPDILKNLFSRNIWFGK